MKIQLKQLDEIKVSLSKLLTAPGVPARVAYRAAKFSKAIAKEIEEMEEARVELVKKYGKDDGKGNFSVTTENQDTFKEQYDEVLKEEIELPDVQLKIDDLEKSGLTMLDIANLAFLLSETDPTERK